jgi:serine protease Do
LIEGKKILYGWLGINVQDISEELAEHFGLESRQGVIVARVLAQSPAEKAGLKDGDVIRSCDGQPLKDVRDLLKRIAKVRVGKRVKLEIIRDRRPLMVNVEVGERPGEEDQETGGMPEEGNWRGIEVGALTPELAEQYRLEVRQGVVVTRITPGSPADDAGLRVGDLILEINRRPITSVSDFMRISKGVEGDVLVKTARGYAVLREREP